MKSEADELRLLVADDDASFRALVTAHVEEAVGPLSILEAADGAEAVELGLRLRPQLALLDVNMPRLGGIEVAATLRGLRPELRLALQSAEPGPHRSRAASLRVPLFEKLELVDAVAWVTRAARAVRRRPSPPSRVLRCTVCGHRVATPTPPARCPRCQTAAAWSHAPWRPFAASGYRSA